MLGTSKLDRLVSFDETNGALTCEGGVTLEQIIRTMAPRGWFPLVTPGTKLVTVGGCIANDVHGKAHHSQGSFNTSSFGLIFGALSQAGRSLVAPAVAHGLFWTIAGSL